MSGDNIPAFDWRRWGPGVVLMLGALLVLGVGAFIEGYAAQSVVYLVFGGAFLIAAAVIFFVKVAEEIHPVTAKWSIDGEVGEVVREVGNGAKGVVRVRSELWSAMSDAALPPGTKVRVARTEGLLAWVEKASEG